MKKISIILMCAGLLITGSCRKDSDFLDVPPKAVIDANIAFSDPNLVYYRSWATFITVI
jgi:hypothetical protein